MSDDDLLALTADSARGFDVEAEEDGPYRRAGPQERRLISALASALKVSRLHALDNIVCVEALAELVGALGASFGRRDRLTVVAGDNRVFVDGAALRARRKGGGWLPDFLEFLTRMGVGGLVFEGTWTLESATALLQAVARLQGKSPAERHAELAVALADVPLPAVAEVLDEEQAKAITADVQEGNLTESERAVHGFARLLALAEASHVAVGGGRSPDFHVRHVRTTLMKLVENLRSGLYFVRLLGLTAQAPGDDALAHHAANVAVLSVTIGRLLGLGRGELVDLGFAAFYHDLGRALVGRAPSYEGEGEDGSTAEPHVLVGLGCALRGRGYGDAGLLRLVVTLEHHRLADGYPGLAGLRAPHLFSRIVGVADAFERLEQGTPWSEPVGPAEALRLLRAEPARFEPGLVGLLEDVVGRTPRGTLLRLADGAVVVVIDGGARRGHRAIGRRLLLSEGVPDPRRTLLEVDAAQVAAELAPADVGPDLDWRRAILG